MSRYGIGTTRANRYSTAYPGPAPDQGRTTDRTTPDQQRTTDRPKRRDGMTKLIAGIRKIIEAFQFELAAKPRTPGPPACGPPWPRCTGGLIADGRLASWAAGAIRTDDPSGAVA